jgi:hypothetical protein
MMLPIFVVSSLVCIYLFSSSYFNVFSAFSCIAGQFPGILFRSYQFWIKPFFAFLQCSNFQHWQRFHDDTSNWQANFLVYMVALGRQDEAHGIQFPSVALHFFPKSRAVPGAGASCDWRSGGEKKKKKKATVKLPGYVIIAGI